MRIVNGLMTCLSVIGLLFFGIVLVVGVWFGWIFYQDASERSDRDERAAETAALATPTPGRVFTSAYPTATSPDMTSSLVFGGSDCDGYNTYMAGSNERTKRINIVVDLLLKAYQDDAFDELDLGEMIEEVEALIDEEQLSSPPVQLQPYSDQSIKHFRIVLRMLQAADREDVNAWNRAVDRAQEFEAEERIDARKACGI